MKKVYLLNRDKPQIKANSVIGFLKVDILILHVGIIAHLYSVLFLV
jgi:hypothetical protein